ncbi:MAG: hypothetical protein ACLTSZ_16410 [Lachnospiraceae bacterium]
MLPIKESFCSLISSGASDRRKRGGTFYFVDGMIKDEAMVKILGRLLGIITKEKIAGGDAILGFSRCCHAPYVEVTIFMMIHDTVVRGDVALWGDRAIHRRI